MVLVTGPTGSGKTVTLYAGLQLLNEPGRNIATGEDPVEMHLDGINQVHVNHRVGLDFAVAMRAFLRQDPDVLMVGEVRDLETAEVAVKAAQTGHLVLSTLHTNSAAETLTRLRNMGVAAFNVATSVSLVIAQRLAREAVYAVSPSDRGSGRDAGPDGVPACGRRWRAAAVRGRRGGMFGVPRRVPRAAWASTKRWNSPRSSRAWSWTRGDSLRLAAEARRQGFEDLRRSGLRKVVTGITSLAEINRVTG